MSDVVFRDYRGVACPMNFARITMDLVDLPSGSLLKVWLDTGEQVGNVSRSLLRDGQTVLETLLEDGHWHMTIRKDTDYV